MEFIHFLQASPLASMFIAGMFGLCIGSFLNVVIYRLPIMMQQDWRNQCVEFLELSKEKEKGSDEPYNLVIPRSRCPGCNHLIRSWENIPVISYLFLKGKCKNCGTGISIRYPFIEVITAVLSVFVIWYFGFTWQAAAALLFTWSMVCLTFIDFDHQLLPDSISLPLLWLGIICNMFGLFTTLENSIIGAIAGYLSLWTFANLFKIITKKEGMGHGDFKLFALLGAWLGWQLLPFIILASSLVGAIIGISLILIFGHERSKPIPFGPYIAIAGWIAMFWGNDITQLYLTFIR